MNDDEARVLRVGDRPMKHPEDAILRIKRVRDSFGAGRPGLKETKDAIEECGWDEERARALLIARGHAAP